MDEYYLANPTFWPMEVHWENYMNAWQAADFGRYMINTVIVGVTSTILSLLITILAAFAFARINFKGRELLFTILLATMMIPGEMFTITNYVTVSNLEWTNSYTVLIIPFLVSVFYIYLLRQNFKQIPDSLYYAAKVDGTSDLKYLSLVESLTIGIIPCASLHVKLVPKYPLLIVPTYLPLFQSLESLLLLDPW